MTGQRKRYQFPLFTSHLDFAHKMWKDLIKKGDIVIDATMGNGHDTLFLATLLFPSCSARLYATDIDREALINTETRLKAAGFEDELSSGRISLIHGCHSKIDLISSEPISLVAYNLGYRPGSGEKEKTTETSTSLMSIEKAMPLIRPGGVISITCYPGHSEGLKETLAIESRFSELILHHRVWSMSKHSWLNKKLAPVVYFLQKSTSQGSQDILGESQAEYHDNAL